MTAHPCKAVVDYFRGKCALISGGSSGIGLATARQLRGAGAHLVLLARGEQRLEQAREQLEALPGHGGEVTTMALDVGDGEAVARALAAPPRPVDVLISNAGVVMPGHFLELPTEQFEEQMRINYMGAVHLTRAVLPSMMERNGGHLAYVSSLVGLMGIFGYTAYAASKFALRGFAECMRCEALPHGVRVSVCYPADVDTPQLAFEEQYKPAETRAIAGEIKAMPADDVAATLLDRMAAGKFHIVPGSGAWFTDLGYRLFPGLIRSMFDSAVRKARG